MNTLIDNYLNRVLVYANKAEPEAAAIRQELKDHLLQKVDALVAEGLSREAAALEALRVHGSPKVVGYGLRGRFPWIDIRSYGTARGVIAIGPKAVGVFAFGGVSMGVFACGGIAMGVFSAGGLALGLLLAWAGLGLGGFVFAGVALGIVAAGGYAAGLVAAGGVAFGAWVPMRFPGAVVVSHYTAANVPGVLRTLASGLELATFIERYIVWIVPAYFLFIAAMGWVQYRETKRVTSLDTWLLDG